jgi:histidinol dehydrogenase
LAPKLCVCLGIPAFRAATLCSSKCWRATWERSYSAGQYNSGKMDKQVIQIVSSEDLTPDKIHTLAKRGSGKILNPKILVEIDELFKDVCERGDTAVADATSRFDEVLLEPAQLIVGESEFSEAKHLLTNDIIEALKLSIENHKIFNEKLKPPKTELYEIGNGILAGRQNVPIENVALYVPSGKGTYPSSFITIAVPAVVAGVREITVIVPPKADGKVDPAVLVAADLLGIKKIYRANGIAGIAAAVYGTATFSRVAKIVGPGGPYIMAAQLKAQSYGIVSEPFFGPTECMIIADSTAKADIVAADLLNEAEHGPDSSAILITDSIQFAEKVSSYISRQLTELPELRRTYAEQALNSYSAIILVKHINDSIKLANELANEHIQIATRNSWELSQQLTSASEILIGQHTPFSGISYTIGVPACLPTGQFARIGSGVTVNTYIRHSAVTSLTKEGLDSMSSAIKTLAEYEGFPAHKRSITLREEKDGTL